jgi:carbon storage regulator
MGYLVISRRTNERILIGDDIEIVVAEISRDKIDLAIKAPRDIQIRRKSTAMQEDEDNALRFRDKFRPRHKAD